MIWKKWPILLSRYGSRDVTNRIRKKCLETLRKLLYTCVIVYIIHRDNVVSAPLSTVISWYISPKFRSATISPAKEGKGVADSCSDRFTVSFAVYGFSTIRSGAFIHRGVPRKHRWKSHAANAKQSRASASFLVLLALKDRIDDAGNGLKGATNAPRLLTNLPCDLKGVQIAAASVFHRGTLHSHWNKINRKSWFAPARPQPILWRSYASLQLYA